MSLIDPPLTLLDTAIYASCSSDAVLAGNYDEVFFSKKLVRYIFGFMLAATLFLDLALF
jgi:hypothetical protein